MIDYRVVLIANSQGLQSCFDCILLGITELFCTLGVLCCFDWN